MKLIQHNCNLNLRQHDELAFLPLLSDSETSNVEQNAISMAQAIDFVILFDTNDPKLHYTIQSIRYRKRASTGRVTDPNVRMGANDNDVQSPTIIRGIDD